MDEEKLIKERLEIIPSELKNLLVSPEFPRRISLIAKKYRFSEDQEKIIRNEILYLCLGLESLASFPIELKEGLSLSDDTTDSLTRDIMDYILKNVRELLVPRDEDLLAQPEKITETPIQLNPTPISKNIKTEIPNIQKSPTPKEIASVEGEDHPTKHEILNEIERPPRTVLKKNKVVYDHDPVNDTSHLLDDKIDDVIKLEESYND